MGKRKRYNAVLKAQREQMKRLDNDEFSKPPRSMCTSFEHVHHLTVLTLKITREAQAYLQAEAGDCSSLATLRYQRESTWVRLPGPSVGAAGHSTRV